MTHTQTRQTPTLDALCSRGRGLAQNGAWPRARSTFQLAVMHYPLEPAAWVGLGWSQSALGLAGPAAVSYSMATGLGADTAEIRILSAECKVRVGEIDAAEDDLERALELAHTTSDAVNEQRAREALAALSALSASRTGGPHA